jgi:hypothetical protein
MGIFIANEEQHQINAGYFDNKSIEKVYKDNNLVWELNTPSKAYLRRLKFWVANGYFPRFYLYVNSNTKTTYDVSYDFYKNNYNKVKHIYVSNNGYINSGNINSSYGYLYTPASIVYLNSNCYAMFNNLTYNSPYNSPLDYSSIKWDYVENMAYMFNNVGFNYSKGLSPKCGPNVTDMNHAYYNCYSLTGSPVCSQKVSTMPYAYYNCTNLTGSPVAGRNATYDLNNAYWNCTNLNGSLDHEEGFYELTNAFYNCYNLTGAPSFIGDRMNYAYYNCSNLTGPLKNIDDAQGYVSYADHAFYNCFNLTGTPAFSSSYMNYMYYNCSNLIGEPVRSEYSYYMHYAYYNCTNLTGRGYSGILTKTMNYAYYNCTNLTEGEIGEAVTSINHAFYGCVNLRDLYVYSTQNFNNNTAGNFFSRGNTYRLNIYVLPDSNINTWIRANSLGKLSGALWDTDPDNNCYYNSTYNYYVYYNLEPRENVLATE